MAWVESGMGGAGREIGWRWRVAVWLLGRRLFWPCGGGLAYLVP
jgi:hypothetical protein